MTSSSRPRRLPALEPLEDRCLPRAGFSQVNLASDVPGLARVTDPNLVNPWGVAFSPTGPFWFGDNGSGVSDVLDGRGQPVPLVVKVPPGGPRRADAGPTGTVFNGGPGFAVSRHGGVAAPARFLFAGEDGTISGWSALVDPGRAVVAVDNSSSGAAYTGLALAADHATGRRFLYAADFGRGRVDVFDQDFRPAVLRRGGGAFRDAGVPDDFAPFNIQNFNNLLLVTYAQREGDEAAAGPGRGFIDVYDARGALLRRFASGGPLDSPWGLALAPAGFGPFGGDLLVGNNGDGHILAYDPRSGAFRGEVAGDDGAPIAVPDLWALTFGNGHAGGAADDLFFAAGLGYDAGHGLFGAIQGPAGRGADTAGAGAFDPRAPGEPGDYPLPPRGGPAFRGSADEGGRRVPTSDLLPLRESSLVALAPTLWTAQQQPAGRPATPAPGAGSRPGGKGPEQQAVGLNTWLDLSASPDGAGHDAGAEALLAAAEESGPPARGEEGEPDERRGPVTAASRPPAAAGPAGGPAAADEHTAAGEGRVGLAGLASLVFAVGLPVIGAYWARRRILSRPRP